MVVLQQLASGNWNQGPVGVTLNRPLSLRDCISHSAAELPHSVLPKQSYQSSQATIVTENHIQMKDKGNMIDMYRHPLATTAPESEGPG